MVVGKFGGIIEVEWKEGMEYLLKAWFCANYGGYIYSSEEFISVVCCYLTGCEGVTSYPTFRARASTTGS